MAKWDGESGKEDTDHAEDADLPMWQVPILALAKNNA